jgi:uncharacterized coiled-coil protein SlyX
MRSSKALAIALVSLGGTVSLNPVFAGDMEDRIAALEQQLAELKSMIASNQNSITSNMETLTLQAEEIEEVRPSKKGTEFQYGGYVQLDAIASNYSEGKPAQLMDDLFVPSLIPVEPPSGESDSYSNTNIHAKTSRFWFKTETDTDAGKV